MFGQAAICVCGPSCTQLGPTRLRPHNHVGRALVPCEALALEVVRVRVPAAVCLARPHALHCFMGERKTRTQIEMATGIAFPQTVLAQSQTPCTRLEFPEPPSLGKGKDCREKAFHSSSLKMAPISPTAAYACTARCGSGVSRRRWRRRRPSRRSSRRAARSAPRDPPASPVATLPSYTAVGCHSLGICTVILRSVCPFAVVFCKMTVSPLANPHLGLCHIVASEIEAPDMVVNLV